MLNNGGSENDTQARTGKSNYAVFVEDLNTLEKNGSDCKQI